MPILSSFLNSLIPPPLQSPFNPFPRGTAKGTTEHTCWCPRKKRADQYEMRLTRDENGKSCLKKKEHSIYYNRKGMREQTPGRAPLFSKRTKYLPGAILLHRYVLHAQFSQLCEGSLCLSLSLFLFLFLCSSSTKWQTASI
jgi:hypothetical protein